MIVKLRLAHENLSRLHHFLHGEDNLVVLPNDLGRERFLLKTPQNPRPIASDTVPFARLMNPGKIEEGKNGFIHLVTLELNENVELGEFKDDSDTLSFSGSGFFATGNSYKVPEKYFVNFFRHIGIFTE